MYHVMIALIALTALLLIRGLIALIFDPWRVEKNQVILSKLLLFIGVPGGALFLIPTCITLFTGESPWLSAGFLAFSWLACSMIVGYFNSRITYSDTEFTVKNFLGFQRTYSYTEITQFRHTTHHDWLYVGRRRILIDELAVNGDNFLAHARKRYRIHHNGNAIPAAPRSKWDIFRGNVRAPGEKIFAIVLVYAVLLVVSVILIIYGRPLTVNDLEFVTITPIHYSVDEDDILLYAPQTDHHYAIDQELLENPDDFISRCTQTEMSVGVRHFPMADTPYYRIYCVTAADGTELLSIDTYNAHTQETLLFVMIVFLVLFLLWTLVSAMIIAVGRYPQKFSPRFAYLFIQKHDLIYTYPPRTFRRKTK